MKATTLILLAVVLPTALPLAAQDAPAPDTAPAAEPLLGEMTAEQWEELLRLARPLLLERERKAVIREIEDGLMFDDTRFEEAFAALQADLADTPADNIRRIVAAFALVDMRLAGPAKKFADGQFEAAAGDLKAVINPNGTGYLDAAKRMMHADALLELGRDEDAVKALREILQTTPEKVSFAAMASLKAGQAYERMHRMLYAANYYAWWMDNYGFLDPATAAALAEKVAAVEAEYRDPLATVAGKMDAVERRLAAADSGEQTRERQQDIVRMLDDLIAMAEDQNSGGSSGSGGAGGRQSSGQGEGGGPPSGTGQPSSPAEVSGLPPGNAPRPEGLSEIHPSDASDAWGKLPIRQREKLVELFKKQYPDRYRQMLEDYYRRLAEQR